jgi:hypothetical protein
MTSVRGCAPVIAVLFLVLAAFLSACGQPKDQLADSCEIKASRRAIDESCAIEISKREVATRLGNTVYAKYNVRFDSAEKLWFVMAYNENGPPDSHVYLSIVPNGEVKDFRGAP